MSNSIGKLDLKILVKKPKCNLAFFIPNPCLQNALNAQWLDRVTKPHRSFSNIETFLHFLNAFGYRTLLDEARFEPN